MKTAPNKPSYIRLNVMRCLLQGQERKRVCKTFSRSDRMVRLWIELFKRGGIDALLSQPKPGRPRRIKLERVADVERSL